MTNVDETTRSTFHMAFSNCSDTCLAAAHQAYIDRETASVFSIGNISDDPGERKKFWSDLEPATQYRDGSATLATDLPATFRNALSTGISKLPDAPPIPVCPLSAWTSRPRCPLRICELNREQFQEISDTIHRPWRQTQDCEHPKKPNSKTPLPGSIQVFQPRDSTVQRRVILELPHDVTDEAREQFSTAGAAPISDPTTPSATLTSIARPIQFLMAQFFSETCPVSASRPATHSQETPSAGCVRTTPASPTSTSETRPPATLRSPLLPRPGRRHHARHAPRHRCQRPAQKRAFRPHGTATFASGKRCRRCRQPPPGTCPERRKRHHLPDPTNRAPACLRRERRPAQNPDRPSCRQPLHGHREDPFPIIRKPCVKPRHALSESTQATPFPRRNFSPPVRRDQHRRNDPLHVSHGMHQWPRHASRCCPPGMHRPRTSLRFFHRKHQRRFRGEQEFLI